MADFKPLKITTAGQLARFQTGDTLGLEHGGTGATTDSAARANLGLAIGSQVQAYDADLAAIAALATSGFAVRTGTNTWSIRSMVEGAGIAITNPAGTAGDITIALADLADSGGGTFLKFTRDAKGRISATTAVIASDITALVNGTYAPINNPTFTGAVTLPGDPASSLQAATKQYVDNLFATGGQAPFLAVRLKTTANHALTGLTAIDGVTPVAADRVLVNNQTAPAENGIYVAAAGAWTRATDADQSAEFAPARQVFVSAGTLYANTGWAVSSAAGPTIGSSTISFTQVSGAAAYTNGNGLSLTGTSFAVIGVAGRITVSGSGVDLASGIVTPGTYTKVTVDTYGRVTTGATATAADVGAQAADATLTALAGYNTTGFLVQTAADTFAGRTLAVTAGELTITNPAGTAGNPTFGLADTAVTPGTYTSVTVDQKGRVTAGTSGSTEYSATSMTNGEAGAVAIGRAMYVSASGSMRLANANNAGTVEVVGLVAATSVASAAAGNMATAGVLTATTTQWDAVTGQTGGLTFNARYYLSNTTAGALTTTAPTSGYVVLVGVALSTTKMKIEIGPVVQL